MPTIKYGAEALEIKNLEIPKIWDMQNSISYEVWGMPECEFDQHVRARVGIKFERIETDDDMFILYPANKSNYENNKEKIDKVLDDALKFGKVDKSFSLMSRHQPYKVTQTLESLMGQMNRRLMFCEEIFIVSVHWLLRHKLLNHPKLTQEGKDWIEKHCKLACDLAKKCVYAEADYLSNMFGCLFRGCGRWPDFTEGYASFNHSCTTPEEINLYHPEIEIYKSDYEIEKGLR